MLRAVHLGEVQRHLVIMSPTSAQRTAENGVIENVATDVHIEDHEQRLETIETELGDPGRFVSKEQAMRISQTLFELRFFFSGGLRIYYTIRGNQIVFLLVGGDKSSRKNDIEKAKRFFV